MKPNTKKLVKKIRPRIERLLDKAQTHCGHMENVDDFLNYKNKFYEFLIVELDKFQTENRIAEPCVDKL